MTQRHWFYILTFGLLGVFAYACWIDYAADWKPYQREYYKRAAAASKDEGETRYWKSQSLGIKQIIARDLGRADRCVTCHVGMDEFTNPSLVNAFTENPYKSHPDMDGLGKAHNFQKFGCTTCHGGQGLATTAVGAHKGIEVHYGESHIAEKYLLKQPFLQGSCAKCHQNFETLAGAKEAARGKKLFDKLGCIGCHAVKGNGGSVSVDLADIADKPPERIAPHDFHLAEMPKEHDAMTAQNWILAHLIRDPATFVRNDPEGKFNLEPIAPSGMPPFHKELKPGEAEAITAYLMSFTKDKIPASMYVYAPPKPEPKFASAVARGKHIYDKFGCAGCHGVDAKQGRRNFNGLSKTQKQDPEKPWDFEEMAKGEEPTLPDTMGTYTREELRSRIRNGVSATAVAKFNPEGPIPPGFMPPWKDKIKGQDMEDLITYLLSIAKKEEGEGW